MNINYISYGTVNTGGYRHEKCLFDTLCNYKKITEIVKINLIRKERLYNSYWGYFQLLMLGFLKSNGHINIVTARTGLSAILRNWFSKNEVWIVLHNFDKNDGKNIRMNRVYYFLFKFLKIGNSKRFKILTVAPFWQIYFTEIIGLKNVFYFPNLFDLDKYKPFQNTIKKQQIHLGQFSTKNDPQIFKLAEKLSQLGYYCYFSTLLKNEALITNDYSIVFFEDFNAYLRAMAESMYTLALININEGWNRIAHESLLVNTPVIGYNNGGLGNLLIESNCHIAKNIEEVYTIIAEQKNTIINPHFIQKYSIMNAEKFITPLCKTL